MNLEEARQVIQQDEQQRAKNTIEGLDALHKQNNTDQYVVMEVNFFGQQLTIDSRMLPPDKTKLVVVPK